MMEIQVYIVILNRLNMYFIYQKQEMEEIQIFQLIRNSVDQLHL